VIVGVILGLMIGKDTPEGLRLVLSIASPVMVSVGIFNVIYFRLT